MELTESQGQRSMVIVKCRNRAGGRGGPVLFSLNMMSCELCSSWHSWSKAECISYPADQFISHRLKPHKRGRGGEMIQEGRKTEATGGQTGE